MIITIVNLINYHAWLWQVSSVRWIHSLVKLALNSKLSTWTNYPTKAIKSPVYPIIYKVLNSVFLLQHWLPTKAKESSLPCFLTNVFSNDISTKWTLVRILYKWPNIHVFVVCPIIWPYLNILAHLLNNTGNGER